jgi:hypothetical protein
MFSNFYVETAVKTRTQFCNYKQKIEILKPKIISQTKQHDMKFLQMEHIDKYGNWNKAHSLTR